MQTQMQELEPKGKVAEADGEKMQRPKQMQRQMQGARVTAIRQRTGGDARCEVLSRKLLLLQ